LGFVQRSITLGCGTCIAFVRVEEMREKREREREEREREEKKREKREEKKRGGEERRERMRGGKDTRKSSLANLHIVSILDRILPKYSFDNSSKLFSVVCLFALPFSESRFSIMGKFTQEK
jgi:hypothetical protein